MAFKVPTFNAWCRVWRAPAIGDPLAVVGYSRCQVRGPDSHNDPGPGATQWQVLLPKGSDVRSSLLSPTGEADFIQVAGWTTSILIAQVLDKGCGFTNEYRIAMGFFFGTDTPPPVPDQILRPINTTLVPPGGFTPLAIVATSSTWPATIGP